MDEGTWCPKEDNDPENPQRTCSMKVDKIDDSKHLTLQCIDTRRCNQILLTDKPNYAPNRQFISCVDEQCPAYMYRSGIDNAER